MQHETTCMPRVTLVKWWGLMYWARPTVGKDWEMEGRADPVPILYQCACFHITSTACPPDRPPVQSTVTWLIKWSRANIYSDAASLPNGDGIDSRYLLQKILCETHWSRKFYILKTIDFSELWGYLHLTEVSACKPLSHIVNEFKQDFIFSQYWQVLSIFLPFSNDIIWFPLCFSLGLNQRNQWLLTEVNHIAHIYSAIPNFRCTTALASLSVNKLYHNEDRRSLGFIMQYLLCWNSLINIQT